MMGETGRFWSLSPRKLMSLMAALCVTHLIITFCFQDYDDKRISEGESNLDIVDEIFERISNTELHFKFKLGFWRQSYTAPGYHKRYDVNCSGIIHNNKTAIRQAYGMTRNASVKVPSDKKVANWTKDCAFYKQQRRYPVKSKSDEELYFPLAYIIFAYNESAQIERLLRSIYQPQNIYCIHIDIKSSPAFRQALRNLAGCFGNVFVPFRLENMQQAGFSRVQADINCMSALLKYQWKYVINLCGEDFPLKTNLEIVKQMKAYRGHNDIPGIYPEQTQYFIGRTKLRHDVIKGEVVRTDIEKPDPPFNATMYFGTAYYAATREYVTYLLTDDRANAILEYLKDSLNPEEHVWVTLNRYPGMPGGYPNSTWESNVRFIRSIDSDYYAPCVGKYVQDICVIGAGYLPYLSGQPHLFANKIHHDYDPIIMQCLEEFLDYRAVFPDSLSEYVDFFPRTDLFL